MKLSWSRYWQFTMVGVGVALNDWGIGAIIDSDRFEVCLGPFWFYWNF